jgi:hypothetical protein
MTNQIRSRSVDRYAVRCLNGLKHGSTATKRFLPDENPADFFALLENTFEAYKPNTERDAYFVADLAHARWFLLRRERASQFHHFNLGLTKPDPSQWTAEDHHKIELLERYLTEAQRAVQRALANLHHFDKEGLRIRPWKNLLELFKERFEENSQSKLAA